MVRGLGWVPVVVELDWGLWVVGRLLFDPMLGLPHSVPSSKAIRSCKDIHIYRSAEEMGTRLLNLLCIFALFVLFLASLAFFCYMCSVTNLFGGLQFQFD